MITATDLFGDATRALSIRQPWAALILSGDKPVENRTWTTGWRGVLIVHAGHRRDDRGARLAANLGVSVDRDSLTGYLGAVDLVDIHPDTGCCRPWGEASAYHWQLRRPRWFAEAVPGPGRLGLYRPPPSVSTHLLARQPNTTAPTGEGSTRP